MESVPEELLLEREDEELDHRMTHLLGNLMAKKPMVHPSTVPPHSRISWPAPGNARTQGGGRVFSVTNGIIEEGSWGPGWASGHRDGATSGAWDNTHSQPDSASCLATAHHPGDLPHLSSKLHLGAQSQLSTVPQPVTQPKLGTSPRFDTLTQPVTQPKLGTLPQPSTQPQLGSPPQSGTPSIEDAELVVPSGRFPDAPLPHQPSEGGHEEGTKDAEGPDREGSGEEEEDNDAMFDEFLDTTARTRLKQLAGKVAALTEALQLAQEECRTMAASKREATREAQLAENERKVLSRQVQALRQESARLHKANTDLNLRVKELGRECQALRKEASGVRQREASQQHSHTTLQTQLNRARSEGASLREQLASLRTTHKEEVERLRERLSGGEERRRELERERRELSAVTKKQEKLIAVLTQQKNHLAAAKAVAGLEQKFLASIAPLQPT